MGPGLPSKPLQEASSWGRGARDWPPTPFSEGPDIFRCTRDMRHVLPQEADV